MPKVIQPKRKKPANLPIGKVAPDPSVRYLEKDLLAYLEKRKIQTRE